MKWELDDLNMLAPPLEERSDRCDFPWVPCEERPIKFYLGINGMPCARCELHYPKNSVVIRDLTREEYEVYLIMGS